MGFFTRKKTVQNVPDADYPAPYGDPNGHFDMPYMVVTTDANSVVPPGNADGTPMVISYESVMPPLPEVARITGDYKLGFVNAPLPSPVFESLNPAPGSVDLERPRDTPFFGPGTNRIIHSKGPVTGVYVERFDGERATIGSQTPGQGGPVTGGPDYAQQLAATFLAAQSVAYSQQASAQALVSAV